jgi:hypothetical protein
MSNYLKSVTNRFETYKLLGEKTFSQLSEEDINWQYNKVSNSIAITVKHIVGNMLSRFTNFLTEDGEKPWRERDAEFENGYTSKTEMLEAWEKGWGCVFEAINPLTEEMLEQSVLIRNEKHTIIEALNRQLAHYAYHIGQIVYVARMLKGNDWKSLSIPKGKSEEFNKNYTPKS